MPFTKIIAGDTHKKTLKYSEYPASEGWSGTFYLNGVTTGSFNTTPSGDDHLLVLSSAQTDNLPSGLYNYAVRMVSGSESYTVATGLTTVVANPETVGARIYTAQRMIELIELALVNQLSDGEAIEALSISGRSLTQISRQELIDERGAWIEELNRLTDRAQGRPPIRTIRISMGRL